MLIILFFTVALLCFACWLIAELEGGRRTTRMATGVLTMVAAAGLGSAFPKFTFSIESGCVRSSLRLAEQLMAAGDTPRVQQAVHAYNERAAASTYQASVDLWNMLNHGPQSARDAKANQTPPPTVGAGSQR